MRTPTSKKPPRHSISAFLSTMCFCNGIMEFLCHGLKVNDFQDGGRVTSQHGSSQILRSCAPRPCLSFGIIILLLKQSPQVAGRVRVDGRLNNATVTFCQAKRRRRSAWSISSRLTKDGHSRDAESLDYWLARDDKSRLSRAANSATVAAIGWRSARGGFVGAFPHPEKRLSSRAGLVVRLLASHPGELGSTLGGVAPGYSHVGMVPDDASGRRVFSFISRFPRPFHSGIAPASPSFNLISSQDLDVKSRPTIVIYKYEYPGANTEASVKQRRNAWAGKTGKFPRKPDDISSTVWRDNHVQKSGCGPADNRTRFALVAGSAVASISNVATPNFERPTPPGHVSEQDNLGVDRCVYHPCVRIPPLRHAALFAHGLLLSALVVVGEELAPPWGFRPDSSALVAGHFASLAQETLPAFLDDHALTAVIINITTHSTAVH
ncbi:hypothetical protein PR048_020495 [Dryococelus australis]|uniref:Uncharacterized protein n=1 Tax=Dryococelus australis TaxID=614101 RepID=A0ABQ9H6V2_9NEOP|nr:hypothetical protein PR048_020495 [Dryococelus australis]